MSNSHSPQIGLAATGNQLYLALDRRATHEVSLAADALVQEFLATQPDRPVIVLELGTCTVLDSTFAGWLLRLRRRLQESEGRVILSGCPRSCRSSLEVMGLTALFEFQTVEPPDALQRVTCADLDEGNVESIEFMRRAHEHLARVNPKNEEAFKPVADLLGRELKKKKT